MTTRISVSYSGDRVGERPTLDVEIVYRKRILDMGDGRQVWIGGWDVVNAANDRRLGRVCGDPKSGWSAYVAADAFRGDGETGETGDVLDEVPRHLYHWNEPVDVDGRTRDSVLEELVYHLAKHRAPALGFRRHYLVRPYSRGVR
jgi:hypothetical protein